MKVLDDEAIARAFRAAERDLAEGRPDTLAGRFSPAPPAEQDKRPSQAPAARRKQRRTAAA